MLHTLLYFLALFSLSTSSNLAKLNQMPVEVLGFYRLGIASLLLGLWLLYKKNKSFFSVNNNINIKWAVASGFFFFLHLLTYKFAAKNTPIAHTMIIFSSNPIWSSLGAVLFLNEKIEKRLYLAYFLAIFGIYTLISHELRMTSVFNWGDFSALISAVFYAAYMLTGKKARTHLDNDHYAFIQYLICAILFGLCVVGSPAQLMGYDNNSWITVLGLVFIPTFLGHFSFTYLVKYMNISLMTCGKLLEPLIASLIAYFLFKETVSPNSWLAFFLTGLSIMVLFFPSLTNNFKASRPS